jgi:hypothetical protein
MQTIVIKNQAEMDALPNSFNEYTTIEIRNDPKLGPVTISKAWGNSSVVAWWNSSVVARDNSSVVARDNSSVVAWDNSSVVARDNSSVVAWGNSSVVARGNSSVVAWGNSIIYHYSSSTILLFGFAVALLFNKTKAIKKSKRATIIHRTALSWFEENGIKKEKTIIVYKRVSSTFKTQENTPNETTWDVAKVLTHTNWQPKENECGEGKFHAVSRPYFADEFRDKEGDKYIAIEVAVKDTYSWPNPKFPHKIAFKKGKVLYECDKFGEKIS